MKKLFSISALVVLAALSFSSIAPAAQLHVGEVGKPILYFPNAQPPSQPPTNPVSLVGLTVVMEIKQPGGAIVSRTMTVEGGGTSCPDVPNSYGACATYLITAGDFPVPGIYVAQWFASFQNTLLLKSDQVSLVVGPSF
jgi:hypothetical protein